MSEHLQIVLNVATGEVSYRLTLRERKVGVGVNGPNGPVLSRLPSSVLLPGQRRT
jgi:hypothetical protein